MMMIVHTNLLSIGAKCVANDLNITHINKQTDATILNMITETKEQISDI